MADISLRSTAGRAPTLSVKLGRMEAGLSGGGEAGVGALQNRVVRTTRVFDSPPARPNGREPTVQRALGPEKFRVLQQFEGTVQKVNEECVLAVLRDWPGNSDTEEYAEIELEEFSPVDRPRLEPGSVFYWTIGYRTDRYGTQTRVSEFRLRRARPLTDAERQRAQRDATALSSLMKKPGG